MTDDEWIRAAMSDDSVVAEALLGLHRSEPSRPPKKSSASALKLEWSVRQRRSKTLPPRKKGDQTRGSPTTPLSWSGGTSISGGGGGGGGTAADGVEESSGAVKPPETVRSKVQISVTSGTTPFKRTRRKKTLAELKEEESLLLKEGKSLKSELASIQLLVEKERARNDILKKMKADSLSSLSCKPMSAPTVAASKGDELGSQASSFLLPDLNIPLDSNPNPEILYGTS